MSLLAYSLRRAAGSLVILLIVIWLLFFAVAHVGPDSYHPVERGLGPPLNELPWSRFQPAVAQTWNIAAIEVGVAAAFLLGLTAVWRVGPKLRRLWPAVGIGVVLLALAIASFGVALANQDYRRLNTECPPVSRGCIPPDIARSMARQFNRGIDPTPWWIDGEIAAGAGVILLGAALAGRRSRSAS
jgi:hypothetical protein